MIKKIIIEKLFNQFNYSIELKDNGVTILTGPNGFGKSTILKSIEALNKGDLFFFEKLEFSRLDFYDVSGLNNLRLRKEKGELKINGIPIDEKILHKNIMEKARRDRYLRRISDDTWIDRRNDNVFKKIDLYEKYYNDYEFTFQIDNEIIENEIDIKDSYNNEIINLIKLMKVVSGDIRYIKEQRLYVEKNNFRMEEIQLINVIDELPNRFKSIVNEVSNEYSYKANKLDSTYPSRLFETKDGISKQEYLNKMSYMKDKFEKLKKYDISDIKIPKGVNFVDEHAKALKVYFEDFENKYEVFNSLIKKLDMFTEIINSRLKFKEIQISRADGISIIRIDDDKKISLNQLSSGEKQEIILFYELIFNIDHNVHLLIDEPEISLHIEWQLKFLDDLLRISEYKNLNVIVATHSPQIINNHWDIQIDLGEEYGK